MESFRQAPRGNASKLPDRLTGKDAEVIAVHAGLECGILQEKFPEMIAISFGPIITGAHSPDEGVKIDSVGRFWELLKATLADLATSPIDSSAIS